MFIYLYSNQPRYCFVLNRSILYNINCVAQYSLHFNLTELLPSPGITLALLFLLRRCLQSTFSSPRSWAWLGRNRRNPHTFFSSPRLSRVRLQTITAAAAAPPPPFHSIPLHSRTVSVKVSFLAKKESRTIRARTVLQRDYRDG